jgi:hypothetical protein
VAPDLDGAIFVGGFWDRFDEPGFDVGDCVALGGLSVEGEMDVDQFEGVDDEDGLAQGAHTFVFVDLPGARPFLWRLEFDPHSGHGAHNARVVRSTIRPVVAVLLAHFR